MSDILIVEDSETISTELKHIVESLDMNPIIATNGQEGIELWQRNKNIKIILCDIHMPLMDGLEMIEEISNTLGERTLPKILMITTETSSEQKLKARQLGVTGWILKPFDQESITEIISKII